MTILKCKACGAPLNVAEGQTIVTCEYCELQQTLPQMDDEFKLQMFNQANDLRRQFDFDGAKSFLQAVVSRYPEEAEAYWGICLCKYGIMYVEDQQTGAQIPTFYRMIPQSILSDGDYQKACQHGGASSWKYEEEAQKIDKLQKKVLELTGTEAPYDIFICYKKTDVDTGGETVDSRIAGQIYMKLVENGYKVFWADRSLPAGCEYEPYIYSALSTAKIMLVLSSDKRYFEATWVKNEWIRFLDMMTRDSSKTIMTCYQRMDPATDIPDELKNLQALNMADMLFSSDLLDHIQKKLPKKKTDMDMEALLKAFQNSQMNSAPQQSAASSHRREIKLADGLYEGDAIAGQPHGTGTYYLSNGDRYEGEWNVGQMNGKGTFFYANGDRWEGEWRNSAPWNGSGIYHEKHFYHEGQMRDGMLTGECKRWIIKSDGVKFLLSEGTFANGRLHGQGTVYLTNDTLCRGEFNNGRPWNAQGRYGIPAFKCEYDGPWENGLPNGRGAVYFENGNIARGTFQNGLNGLVAWKFPDGRIYEGTIKNGKLSGHGKMFSKTHACIYEGEYENDQPHGQGTYYYQQGSWTGEWNNGRRWKGKGLVMHTDEKGNYMGSFYNGYIVNGMAAGKGMLRNADGTRFDGEFLKDKYYNGKLYDANNVVIDTFVNGVSQQNRAQAITNRVWNTASGVVDGVLDVLSKL